MYAIRPVEKNGDDTSPPYPVEKNGDDTSPPYPVEKNGDDTTQVPSPKHWGGGKLIEAATKYPYGAV